MTTRIDITLSFNTFFRHTVPNNRKTSPHWETRKEKVLPTTD